MRIVTLIENLVYQKGLIAEHGLSLYIETGDKKILFDTGQGDSFLKNAKTLGINLADIDAVVISHGHYDHTGGLYAFLLINSKAKVYVKKEAFIHKYHGDKKFIGITFESAFLNGRVEYVSEIVEIANDIFIMPEIPVKNPVDTYFRNFKILKSNGFGNDEFQDELFLTVTRNDELSIITGCSHRGITNIISAAVKHFNLPVNLILGGFHMQHCTPEQEDLIVDTLKQVSPKSIGVCHCTGGDKYANIKAHIDVHVFYNYTGFELNIG